MVAAWQVRVSFLADRLKVSVCFARTNCVVCRLSHFHSFFSHDTKLNEHVKLIKTKDLSIKVCMFRYFLNLDFIQRTCLGLVQPFRPLAYGPSVGSAASSQAPSGAAHGTHRTFPSSAQGSQVPSEAQWRFMHGFCGSKMPRKTCQKCRIKYEHMDQKLQKLQTWLENLALEPSGGLPLIFLAEQSWWSVFSNSILSGSSLSLLDSICSCQVEAIPWWVVAGVVDGVPKWVSWCRSLSFLTLGGT